MEAEVALAESGGGWVGVGASGVVVASEAEGGLGGQGGDGGGGDVEDVVGAELGEPVDVLKTLGDAEAEKLLDEGIGGGVAGGGVPVVDVGAGAVVEVEADGAVRLFGGRMRGGGGVLGGRRGLGEGEAGGEKSGGGERSQGRRVADHVETSGAVKVGTEGTHVRGERGRALATGGV